MHGYTLHVDSEPQTTWNKIWIKNLLKVGSTMTKTQLECLCPNKSEHDRGAIDWQVAKMLKRG